MIKKWRRWLGSAGIAGGLGLGAAAMAQTTSFQPFKGLFSPRTVVEQKSLDSNRMTEIQVELAWLSDRLTFPYFLEARIKGTSLEVRGYVPNKAVREQAVSLAKLNCPLPVSDTLKEHASLAIRPIRRAPEQLKSAVQTALRETIPGNQLSVQCQSDGNVQIAGTVRSFEQKLAVSLALRRLHGCACVTNITEVGGGEFVRQAPAPATNMARTSVIATGDPGGQPSKGAQDLRRSGPFTLFTKAPPPSQPPTKAAETSPVKITTVDTPGPELQPAPTGLAKTGQTQAGQPYESRGVIIVSAEETFNTKTTPEAPTALRPTAPAPKTANAGPTMSASQLKKRIESVIPGARNVTVTFTSKTDVRVECSPRAGDDGSMIAGQILSLRELEPYKVDLQIQLPTSDHK